jgi:hypothetical protein
MPPRRASLREGQAHRLSGAALSMMTISPELVLSLCLANVRALFGAFGVPRGLRPNASLFLAARALFAGRAPPKPARALEEIAGRIVVAEGRRGCRLG